MIKGKTRPYDSVVRNFNIFLINDFPNEIEFP